SAKKESLGKLPAWDLGDLYAGISAPKITADLKRMETASKSFAKKYQGKVAKLSGDAFGKAIKEFESIDEILSKILSYAQLVCAANVTDPKLGKFQQEMSEKATDISTHLIFFTLEINRISDVEFKKKVS